MSRQRINAKNQLKASGSLGYADGAATSEGQTVIDISPKTFVAGSLRVFVGGSRLTSGQDFVIDNDHQITLNIGMPDTTRWTMDWDEASYIVNDANSVNGIQASATPVADKLLALDSGSKFPSSVIPAGSVVGFTSAFSTDIISGTIWSNWGVGMFTTSHGGDIITLSYTPKAAGNKLFLMGHTCIRRDAGGDLLAIAGIFVVGTTNAIVSTFSQEYASGFPSHSYSCHTVYISPGTSELTFKLRAAVYSGHTGTTYLNYASFAGDQGGANLSIMEISV